MASQASEFSAGVASIPFIVSGVVQLLSGLISKAINKKGRDALRSGNAGTVITWAGDVTQSIGAISAPLFGLIVILVTENPQDVDGWIYVTYGGALALSGFICVWIFCQDAVKYGKGRHGGDLLPKLRLKLSPVTFWGVLLNCAAVLFLWLK